MVTLSKFLQSNERTLPEIRGQDAVDAEGNIVGMATSPIGAIVVVPA